MNKEAKLGTGKVPREKAFYFFTSIGNYTGKSASSLSEFMEKINEVDVKSLEFHFYRKDFEKWFIEVLHDEVLAEEIKKLYALNLIGEPLRSHLYKIVSTRLKQLTTSEVTV
ncbi:MAG: DUF5752 family protein [Nitrososphaerota archaeon]|nr:DUF5752 family protein [Candidatus Bathyarchaeota archaeon]MDW8023174.1 DUF5752 family protein [Nitrososphaerota archaeon]